MKKFYIWKNKDCNGINPEWLEISGIEFIERVRNPENKMRKFIKWQDEDLISNDIVYYETTPDAFREWDRSRKNINRIRQHYYDNNIIFVDWDEIVYNDDEGPITRADMIPDPNSQVEPSDEEILLRTLREALKTLDKEERNLIDKVFLDNPDKRNQSEIAKELGMSQQRLSYHLQNIFNKMRICFVKTDFLSKQY